MSAGWECYHCKQWVEKGEPHDCWTTTEAALTADLSEDLRDAWERLRETAAEFGEQRIYASHHSIMFSRKSCYFFVRPKSTYLEICVFLGRTIEAPQIRRVEPASKVKMVHFVRVPHRNRVPLSRRAVFARDGHRCQYCNRTAENIDHVVPRSRGGPHAWDNVVASCRSCNARKEDRLPAEAGLRLHRPPRAPHSSLWLVATAGSLDPAWEPYLPDAIPA